ncbi:MAG: hypothetical protein HYU63_04785 [Armatimonadetes bacterium]|nr:hypothetical protein [Armatimonadota bacterium]
MTIKGVDLTPVEKKKISFDLMWLVVLGLIALAFFGYWVFGKTYDGKIAARQEEIVQIENEIKDIETNQIPGINEIKDKIKNLRIEIEQIKKLSKNPTLYSNLLDEFRARMPANIWISNLSIEPASSSIAFNGTVLTLPEKPPLATLALFIRELQNSTFFREPVLSSVSQSEKEGLLVYSFQMDLNYNPDIAIEGGAEKR